MSPGIHNPKYNVEKTPFLIMTKTRLYAIAMIYLVSMIFLLVFLMVINYSRIDAVYKGTMVHQLSRLDETIGIYTHMLTDRLNTHTQSITHRLNNCSQLKDTDVNTISNSTILSNYVIDLNNQYVSLHSNDEYISTIFFTYNSDKNKYQLPQSQNISSQMYTDMINYLNGYNTDVKNISITSRHELPHVQLNMVKMVSIDNRWYITTVIQYKNTNLYILSSINILSDHFDKLITTYMYQSQLSDNVLYPVVRDIDTGIIIYHPTFKNDNVYRLMGLSKSFIDSRNEIVAYEFQGTKRYGINKVSKHIPWVISIVFNKKQVMERIFYFNLFPMLGLFLSNVIILYVFINRLNTNKYMTHYKNQGIVCVCDGRCIVEQRHCRDILLQYKARMRTLYEYFFTKYTDIQKAGEDNITKYTADVSTMLKDIDTALDTEINKFDDPNYFRKFKD